MKRTRSLVLIAFVALLALPFCLPSAASADTLAQKRAHARQIMGQLAVLDTRMEKVVERYDAATGKLDAIKTRIAANQHTLLVTRYNLQIAKTQLKQRVVAIYKQRPVELLDVMLSTKSFTSMVDQIDMLHRVGSSQSDMVDSIDTYQTTIRAAQKSLVTDRTAAQALVTQRATEKAGVEAALSQRQSMLRGVKAQIAALTRQQEQRAQQAAQSAGVVAPAGPISTNDTNVVTYAESFVGKVPYVYGGSTTAGFDCSGFTMYVYSHFGVGLPHNAAAQQSGTQAVPAGQEQPGDLVFFGNPAYHVGIYVGGGSMVNAPHTGAMVSYGSVAGASGFGRP